MTSLANPFPRQRQNDRKVAYTSADFDRVAALLHRSTGIRLAETNHQMVYARLVTRILELGLDQFADYLDRVLDPTADDERDRFISALTTNTTHFYREAYHFQFLETEVFPDLIERAKAGDRVRLWSAGCSTGEEAYSLAICLLNAFPHAGSHDVKILGTDVDKDALARAEIATYGSNCLRDMPQALLESGLDCMKATGKWVPKDTVRALVTFRRLNLIGNWPFKGQFDVIFCRNVAIYMDLSTQGQIWSAFHDAMQPGGYLFIGHSERLPQSLRSKFQAVGNTIFRHAP